MIWARHLKSFTKIGVAALSLSALAAGGNAQDSFQGKFTLPFETHWGSATLPAGDYSFTLPSNSAPYRFYIHGRAANAIIQASTAEQQVASERPQLNLVDVGDVHSVQTFEAPELGVTFTYWTPSEKHLGHKVTGQKTVPLAGPASQASETHTSIAVHTAGR
jgi:hypothetical protein